MKAICSLEGQTGFSNRVGGKSEDSRCHLLDAQQCSQLSFVLGGATGFELTIHAMNGPPNSLPVDSFAV